MHSSLNQIAEAIRAAAASNLALRIQGGGSKAFYGVPVEGAPLSVTGYRGIVEYEPSELVLTVRAGTPLTEVEAALAEQGQCLAFEPPHFGASATIGGCVATGLSGPRRAYAGSVRDFVLGVRVLDGTGEDLRFGGKVIKNVAGYDVSRLMVGALGTLGVITEVSFKVLPRPVTDLTLRLAMGPVQAIETMNRWAGQPLPLSATCYFDGSLWVRLAGAEPAVRVASARLGGEIYAAGPAFWSSIREQTHPAFAGDVPLWRLSLRPTTPALGLPGNQLIEWGGALRWLRAPERDAEAIRALAQKAGGHAILFRGGSKSAAVFHPLAPALEKIHTRLKQVFDPMRILNPGRMGRF